MKTNKITPGKLEFFVRPYVVIKNTDFGMLDSLKNMNHYYDNGQIDSNISYYSFIEEDENGERKEYRVKNIKDINDFLDNNYKFLNIENDDNLSEKFNIHLERNDNTTILISLEELQSYLRDGITFEGICYEMVSDKNNKEDQANIHDETIRSEEIDFSNITVVLGKTGSHITSSVVEKVQEILQKIGVNVYISDIDKLTLDIYEQAANENPNDDILGLRISNESNGSGRHIIMVDMSDETYGIEGPLNSDSLALCINNTLEDSIVANSKNHSFSYTKEKSNTSLGFGVRHLKLRNPGIKVTTVAIDSTISEDIKKISTSIAEGIVYYASLNRKQRDTSYFHLSTGLNGVEDERKLVNELPEAFKKSIEFNFEKTY
ncbi:MAG: hypothetical protein ACI4OG_01515 [Bacilli bacterium]